ncbi:MAG: DUF4159 domain-containing protein [Hyphomicrobiaceae bacterium]|nr:DUF4159 domain-containing protein [Hyphomicrobiaceae bacterium]
MFGLPLAFTAPLALLGLLALPALWFLLRVTPPRPKRAVFPPLVLLERLKITEETPSRTPLWIVLMRMALAALLVFAFAGPVARPADNPLAAEADGPLVIVIDTGWGSAAGFAARINEARRLLTLARSESRTAILVPTAARLAGTLSADDPARVADRLAALEPLPLRADRSSVLPRLEEALSGTGNATITVLLDGLAAPGDAAFLNGLAALAPGRTELVTGALETARALTPTTSAEALVLAVSSAVPPAADTGLSFSAFDARGRLVARTDSMLAAGATRTEARFTLPLELRNAITRVVIDGEDTAGAVQLIDDGARPQRIAIIRGEDADIAQPLLSGATYVERALRPYNELLTPASGNVTADIEGAVTDRASVIVLIDIGNLTDVARAALDTHLARGGVVLRFAGPALGTSDDGLVPVPLRRDSRRLGGALSWETPQPIAPFPEGSPFAGLTPPGDVFVNRQILAEPDPSLRDKVWVELADGTPLVTADRRGPGTLVLFHITADTRWSDLPLSSVFVDMLRRIAAMGRLEAGTAAEPQAAANAPTLPARAILDGRGRLGPPPAGIEPIAAADIAAGTVSLEHPPGFYGEADAPRALNLFAEGETIEPFAGEALPAGLAIRAYPAEEPLDLRPWLLAGAFLLALADTLAMAILGGALKLRRRTVAAALALLAALGLPQESRAQTPADVAILALSQTRIGYVETGDAAIDRLTRAGVAGLSRILGERTSFEPGEPMAVDPEHDELAFFPLLYWPMPDAPITVTDTLVARIDAYMRNGGTILFDTRDEGASPLGGVTPQTQNLRALLAQLDIPPLEPVPADHVLTKAFYLLNDFPGRFRRGSLWVEALPERRSDDERPARAGDGVSPILISGNDLAGAWALDDGGRPLLPTIPPDPRQRELAFRAGVNILMYVLTGNYKADQVHIPALLERLGQ